MGPEATVLNPETLKGQSGNLTEDQFEAIEAEERKIRQAEEKSEEDKDAEEEEVRGDCVPNKPIGESPDDGKTKKNVEAESMEVDAERVDEAVDLVLLALERMEGGERFIPKLPAFKVTDLADAIDPGGRREIVGIRIAEKIHETYQLTASIPKIGETITL